MNVTVSQRTSKLVRWNPIPCKVCSVMFSGRSYKRYNCDLHYRQMNEETKKKFSDKQRLNHLGKKRAPFTKEWIENLRAKARRGELSYKWKGGVTPINERIRKSAEYVEWRKKIFKRDNYTCVLCDNNSGDKHADHIKPFAYFPELRFDLTNGRTLCVPCHRKTDTYGEKAKLCQN